MPGKNADPMRAVKAQERERKRQQALVEHYNNVFRTPSGEAVLKDLMQQFSIFKSTASLPFNKDEMVFREGERNVPLYIMDKLNLAPDELEARFGEIKSDLKWLIDEEQNDSSRET